jgi:dipeptidyl-peptidase 4
MPLTLPFLLSRRRARLARPGGTFCLGLLLFSSAVCLFGEEIVDRSRLTLDRLFGQAEFKAEDWGPARWLEDGSGYTTLVTSEKVKDVEGPRDVVRYRPDSGAREIIVPASSLIPRGQSKPLKIEDYAWSADGVKLLIFTNTKRVWRRNTQGDYWVFDLKSGNLHQLGGRAAPSTLRFATFSPEGRRVAYVCHNNLFVQSLDNLRITRLTKNGSDTLINGTSDWVYEEEFGFWS